MAIHRDPTADAAIGSVNREWKRMVRRAVQIRKTHGELSEEERQKFTGIYRRLLNEPVDVLERLLVGRE